jgi:CRISPR/Cas system-associated exonuclease Cas4 (RecB family)
MGGVLSLTYSKVKTFLSCRKAYWFGYESGLSRPPETDTIGGMIGTGVHRALARLCDTGDPAHGASELDAYLRMPSHEAVGPGTDYHTHAFEFYERGVAAHQSIESDDRWAEFQGQALTRSGGIRLWAKIDRADRLPGGQWQVIDWKTGRFDVGEETDAQLDIYHVIMRTVRRLPSEANVTAIGWNLRTGEKRVRALGRADAVATLSYLSGIARRIQSMEQFEAMPGPACGFCRWRSQCPDSAEADAFAEALFAYDPEPMDEPVAEE